MAVLENGRDSCFAPQALAGKRALVTGAGSGIGRATALAMAAMGADLALMGRRKEALEETISLSGDKRMSAYCADISDPGDLKEVLAKIELEFNGLDIVVNCAGVYRTEPIKGHRLAIWNEVMATNLTSALIISEFFLEGMLKRKWGRVINISSISGKSGEAFGAAYSASKFGLIGLTESMALEVASSGITVNAVCPGWVETDMALSQIEDPDWCSLTGLSSQTALEITRLSVPQGRLLQASEVADLVAFLATEQARGITGQAINICGGLSIH